MAKKKSQIRRPSAMEEEYLLKYGGIPSDEESLLEYLREHYPFTDKALEKAMEYYGEPQWETVEFVLYLIPEPSPRPRYSSANGVPRFYVRGANANKKLMKQYIERHIISTRCEVYIEAYIPPPRSSMTNAELYMAEKKLIAPLSGGDVDNIMKTYLDAITGVLLVHDNIVTAGHLEKWYSIKPRLKISIRYQTRFDSRFNEKRMLHSSVYQREMGLDEPK